MEQPKQLPGCSNSHKGTQGKDLWVRERRAEAWKYRDSMGNLTVYFKSEGMLTCQQSIQIYML